eukprot:4200317-Prorocentrum_lima.AAC.1
MQRVSGKRGDESGDACVSLFCDRLLVMFFKKVLPDRSIRSVNASKDDIKACVRRVPRRGILATGRQTFDMNVKRLCELNG